jgi:ribosomal protein S18 acetylase RimI-like enzyme
VGTELFNEVIERLTDGIEVLKVETFENVDKSTSFYRKNGFEKFDERKVGNEHIETLEEKKDTLLMKKDL